MLRALMRTFYPDRLDYKDCLRRGLNALGMMPPIYERESGVAASGIEPGTSASPRFLLLFPPFYLPLRLHILIFFFLAFLHEHPLPLLQAVQPHLLYGACSRF